MKNHMLNIIQGIKLEISERMTNINTLERIRPAYGRHALMMKANQSNRPSFLSGLLLTLITVFVMTVITSLLFSIGISGSPGTRAEFSFSSPLLISQLPFSKMVQVAYAEEKSIADVKDNIDKVNDATGDDKRSNELLGAAIDKKVKAKDNEYENENENDAQMISKNFKNLKASSNKLNEAKLPGKVGDREKGNFAYDDTNNIRDLHFPSQIGESKVSRSETICSTSSSSSSSSPSCSKAKYCKSPMYSKNTYCTQPDPGSNEPLRAKAGPDQVVKSGQIVTLNGEGKFDMNAARDDYTFSWIQLSPRQPTLKLDDRDIPTLRFQAPIVSHNTVFIFELSVKKDGYEHKDRVKLLVIKSDESDPLSVNNVTKTIIPSQDKQHDRQLDGELNHNASNSEENIGEKKVVRDRESSGHLQLNNDTSIVSSNLDKGQKDLYTSKSEDSFSLSCSPDRIIISDNIKGSIVCTIHNESPLPITLRLKCSGLDGTQIQCFINNYYNSGTIVVKEKSTKAFPVVAVTFASTHVEGEAKSYPFTISAN
jgi:hypothetical protein